MLDDGGMYTTTRTKIYYDGRLDPQFKSSRLHVSLHRPGLMRRVNGGKKLAADSLPFSRLRAKHEARS
jgi:hypothetical protein